MDNGIILLITFILPLLIVVVFYYILGKQRKKDGQEITTIWKHYQRAILSKHTKGIKKYGEALIWNEHLTDEMLRIMTKDINDLIDEFTELEELRLLIFNKFLHWNRDYHIH